jgi:predicted HNH restriction endonuclease
VPREKPELIETNHGKRYKRDKQRSINALHRANYLCEYKPSHETFIRKSGDVNYTESHHLVPMAFQSLFDVTLDTEANIVSLCSNCHNHIHYGKGADEIIKELYKQRKEALKKEGIVITIEKLLSMYKEI